MISGLLYRTTQREAGWRLDAFLRDALPLVPPRSVRHALSAGEVSIGSRRGRGGDRLATGDVVTVGAMAEAADWLPLPPGPPGALLLYADGEAAVLEKPAGVHTEPLRPREAGTLAGTLLHLFPAVAGIAPVPGLTLLTRLDRETSGAVLAALSAPAYAFLVAARGRGEIRKAYACLVRGRLDRELSLTDRIEARGGERVRVRKGERDPDPLGWTRAVPIAVRGDLTAVRAEIAKGKRHQVRAHLAAAGFPVVGDRLYGPPGVPAGRLMLHAAEVTFPRPDGGGMETVVSPPPGEFGLT